MTAHQGIVEQKGGENSQHNLTAAACGLLLGLGAPAWRDSQSPFSLAVSLQRCALPLASSSTRPPDEILQKAWDSASKGPTGLAAAPLSEGHQARVSRAPAAGVTPKGPCAQGLATKGLLGRGDRFLVSAGPAHRPRRGHAATAASCVTTSGPRSPDTREQATPRASGSPSPPRTHSQSSLGPSLHRPTSPPHTR